jgi:hypothetical protein
MLDVAFDVIKAWDVRFKIVAFYWVKENIKSPGLLTGLGTTPGQILSSACDS